MKTSSNFEPLSLRGHLEDATEKTLHLGWCPFVNVIVVGLGLFLLSSKWVCPPGVQVHLPKVKSSLAYGTALPAEDIVVIDKDLRIFFNNRFFHSQQVTELFHREHGQDTLILKADEAVPIGYILKISEQARTDGYKTVQIAVDAQ